MARGRRTAQTTKTASAERAKAEDVLAHTPTKSTATPPKDDKTVAPQKSTRPSKSVEAESRSNESSSDDEDFKQFLGDQDTTNENWGDCLVQALGAEDRVQSVHKLTQLGKGVGVFSKNGKSLFWTWAEPPQRSLSPDDVRSRGFIGEYSTASGGLIRILGQNLPERPSKAAAKQSSLQFPAVLTLALNPSNPLQLLSVSRDGVIRVWDTTDGSLLRELETKKTIRTLIPHPTRSLSYFIVSYKVNQWQGQAPTKDKEGADEEEEAAKGNDHEDDENKAEGDNDDENVSSRRRAAAFGYSLLTFDSQPSSTGQLRYTLNKLGSSAFAPAGVAINPDGSLLAAAIGKQVWLWNLATDTFHRFRHDHPLSCIAFHPTDAYFTVGDIVGALTSFHYQKRRSSGLKSSLWGNSRGSSSAARADEAITTECVTSRLKWHPHEVLSLCFTEDGAFLLSGGHEGVLVIWQLRTGAHNFLPRFGDTIARIVVGPAASTYALALVQSNTVVLVDAATLKIRSHIQGFQRAPTGRPAIGLLASPLSPAQQVITNGIAGSLQWFNVHKGTSDRVLEVAYNSIAVRNKNYRLPPCEVTNAAVSHDGSWLVTADHRFDTLSQGRSLSETTLRFWQYSTQAATYELNTSVLNPHKNNRRLLGLRFHPHDDLVVSCAAGDSTFRFWTPVVQARRTPSKVAAKHSQKARSQLSWVCRSIGQYQEHARVNECAFSLDGSLLAVCCGPVVSLWDPYLNVLLRTLVHSPDKAERVTAVRFVQSHPLSSPAPRPHLVAFTASRMIMWDLLTCEVAWEVSIAYNEVAVSPDGSLLAVTSCLVEQELPGLNVSAFQWQRHGSQSLTQYETSTKHAATFICLFETGQPAPVKTWRLSTTLHGLVFLGNKSITALSVKNEFLSFSLDDSDVELAGVRAVAGQQLAEEQDNSLAIFVDAVAPDAAKPSAASSLTPASSIHLDAASKILDTPSHLLPALSSLYSTFMSAILRPAAASSSSSSASLVDDAPILPPLAVAESGERAADDSFREFQTLKATLSDTYESAHYQPFAEVFTGLFRAGKLTAVEKPKPTAAPSQPKSDAKPASQPKSGAKPISQASSMSAPTQSKVTPTTAKPNHSPAKLKSHMTPVKPSK